MKKIIQLAGLDCAGCAMELERRISKIEGVDTAFISFANQRLVLECQHDKALQAAIDKANSFEKVRVVEIKEQHSHTNYTSVEGHTHVHKHGERCLCGCSHDGYDVEKNEKVDATCTKKQEKVTKYTHLKEWIMIAISALFCALGIAIDEFAQGTAATIAKYAVYAFAYVAVGYSVWFSTFKNIKNGRIFDENFLMAIASVGAMCLGELEEAVLVMLLYQIGELLQAIAVGSSRRSVADLMALKSEQANLLVNGEQIFVHPTQLKVGDVILVKAGEKVPVDGVLLSDEAILDTKSLTGESEHRHVKKGEEMLSGCINVGGMYEMKVVRLYEDSAVGRILELVENAASGKAEPEKFITKFARYYTPVVCCLALTVAIFMPMISGLIADGRLYFKDFDRWLHSALTFLVISCPCALVISVPLTYFSGIGVCAQKGVLVKGATFLDVLTQANIIAFDKTGTLTEGNFTVCSIQAVGMSENELLELVTAAEMGSSHPIAKALMGEKTSLKASAVREFAGRGVRAEINGDVILVGNAVLMKEQAVPYPNISSPYTLIYVAKNGVYCGVVEIGDRVRKEAKATIEQLKTLGFTRTMILTGDNEPRSYKVAHETGVHEVYATLLPDEKLCKVNQLKREGIVVYVGDGINDAPVMTVADCAVSMGQLGSAAAVEASDLVLVSDNLHALTHAVKTAKRTHEVVLQNIAFSIAMKGIFMILGLCNVLPLWAAVLADVGVMLLAVFNSFRVRGRK